MQEGEPEVQDETLPEEEPPEEVVVPQTSVLPGNGKQTTSEAMHENRSSGGQQKGGPEPPHFIHCPVGHTAKLSSVQAGTPLVLQTGVIPEEPLEEVAPEEEVVSSLQA